MQDLSQVRQLLVDDYTKHVLTNDRLFQLNEGLIHVLQVINDSPTKQMSTRSLLKIVKSHNMRKNIEKAHRLGLIRRESMKMPQGRKGGNMVMNSITETGKLLLEVENTHRKMITLKTENRHRK
jgi:hypothetical protein